MIISLVSPPSLYVLPQSKRIGGEEDFRKYCAADLLSMLSNAMLLYTLLYLNDEFDMYFTMIQGTAPHNNVYMVTLSTLPKELH